MKDLTPVRLIDAEALKEEVKNTVPYVHQDLILDIIDTAPTVELTEEQAIDKLHETGWLIRHDKEMTERPKGDLISRSALLKAILEAPNDNPSYYYTGDLLDRERVLDEIDNAPTVEEKSYAMGYQDGLEDGLQDMRPQGEWVFRNGVTCIGYYKCSNCGEVERAEKNFCPNCGADMRGEKNETTT